MTSYCFIEKKILESLPFIFKCFETPPRFEELVELYSIEFKDLFDQIEITKVLRELHAKNVIRLAPVLYSIGGLELSQSAWKFWTIAYKEHEKTYGEVK